MTIGFADPGRMKRYSLVVFLSKNISRNGPLNYRSLGFATKGSVALPFGVMAVTTSAQRLSISPSTRSKNLGWPIQAFFWLEWGCCEPIADARQVATVI
jgi:hypothetical protein